MLFKDKKTMQLIGAMLLGSVVGWLLILVVPFREELARRAIIKRWAVIVFATFSAATIAWFYLPEWGAIANLSGVLLGALGALAIKCVTKMQINNMRG